MQTRWSAVDAYIKDRLMPHDAVLMATLRANRRAGLPAQDVSPPQGKLLPLLARMVGARRILESARWAAIPRSGSPAPCRRTVWS